MHCRYLFKKPNDLRRKIAGVDDSHSSVLFFFPFFRFFLKTNSFFFFFYFIFIKKNYFIIISLCSVLPLFYEWSFLLIPPFELKYIWSFLTWVLFRLHHRRNYRVTYLTNNEQYEDQLSDVDGRAFLAFQDHGIIAAASFVHEKCGITLS